jgi:hypothetical protein
MLSVIARRNTDPQTFGELFYACYDEIQDMTLMEALALLLELFKSTMKRVLVLSEEKVKELLFYFVNSHPGGQVLILEFWGELGYFEKDKR